MDELTQILDDVNQGLPGAGNRLLEEVYGELRRLASSKLRREPRDLTLQATALVHETYLRLFQSEPNWQNRCHFFSAAATAMRRVLVDNARRRNRKRRGGGENKRERLRDVLLEPAEIGDYVLELDEALQKLSEDHAVHAKIVELRFFAGFTMSEVAETLEISLSTVNRHWAFAKAWLFDAIRSMADDAPDS